jgi:hypothetical protein
MGPMPDVRCVGAPEPVTAPGVPAVTRLARAHRWPSCGRIDSMRTTTVRRRHQARGGGGGEHRTAAQHEGGEGAPAFHDGGGCFGRRWRAGVAPRARGRRRGGETPAELTKSGARGGAHREGGDGGDVLANPSAEERLRLLVTGKREEGCLATRFEPREEGVVRQHGRRGAWGCVTALHQNREGGRGPRRARLRIGRGPVRRHDAWKRRGPRGWHWPRTDEAGRRVACKQGTALGGSGPVEEDGRVGQPGNKKKTLARPNKQSTVSHLFKKIQKT